MRLSDSHCRLVMASAWLPISTIKTGMSGAVRSRTRPETQSRGKNEQEQGCRYECGQGDLGQVVADISVERLHAFGGGVGQLTGTLAAGVDRSQGHQVGRQPVLQLAF